MPQYNSKKNGARKTVSKTALSHALNGFKLRLNSDPSSVVSRPWSPLTVVVPLTTTAANKSLLAGDINTAIKSQIGVTPAGENVEFRIIKVRVYQPQLPTWDITRTTASKLAISVKSTLIGGTELCYLTDKSPAVEYNRVGYHYPKAISTSPLQGTSGATLLVITNPFFALTDKTFECVVYLDVLYRFDLGDPVAE